MMSDNVDPSPAYVTDAAFPMRRAGRQPGLVSPRIRGGRAQVGAVCGGPTLQDDGLRLQEGVQPLGAALAADAGLLEAAERDAEVGAERVVADRARAQLAGDVPGPLHVVGEDGRVEPVDGVVGDGDGVLLVLRRDHAQHRPEDLLLRDRRGVVDVAEDGGLNEPAPVEVLRPAAAGRQRGSFRHALGDVALDPVALALGDQGAHVGLGVERVADLHLGEDAGQRVDELVVAVLADDDPRQRGADLSGEEALGAGQRWRPRWPGPCRRG